MYDVSIRRALDGPETVIADERGAYAGEALMLAYATFVRIYTDNEMEDSLVLGQLKVRMGCINVAIMLAVSCANLG